MELPEDKFGDLILPKFRESARGLHEIGFDLVLDMDTAIGEIGSPSHAVRVQRANGRSSSRVSLAPEKEVPDRDLVLDVRTAASQARVQTGQGSDGRGHFAITVPSTAFGEASKAPPGPWCLSRPIRLDVGCATSASDEGGGRVPVSVKARKISLAWWHSAIGQNTFRSELVSATTENRLDAHRFLDRIEADGGTELANAVRVAQSLLRQGGRRWW